MITASRQKTKGSKERKNNSGVIAKTVDAITLTVSASKQEKSVIPPFVRANSVQIGWKFIVLPSMNTFKNT